LENALAVTPLNYSAYDASGLSPNESFCVSISIIECEGKGEGDGENDDKVPGEYVGASEVMGREMILLFTNTHTSSHRHLSFGNLQEVIEIERLG
jgi:hypothetical protein